MSAFDLFLPSTQTNTQIIFLLNIKISFYNIKVFLQNYFTDIVLLRLILALI